MNKTAYEEPMEAKIPTEEAKMSRSEALATHLESGASALAGFAGSGANSGREEFSWAPFV